MRWGLTPRLERAEHIASDVISKDGPARRPTCRTPPAAPGMTFTSSTGAEPPANVAVNLLDRSGNNLTGVTIPGVVPAATYPGEAGAATVPVASGHTRNLTWTMPTTGGPGFDGVTDVVVTVRSLPINPSSSARTSSSTATSPASAASCRSNDERSGRTSRRHLKRPCARGLFLIRVKGHNARINPRRA